MAAASIPREGTLLQVKKAVIPAAGLGTRFLPATKAIPKELLPVVSKPVIQYVVEEAVAAGIAAFGGQTLVVPGDHNLAAARAGLQARLDSLQ